MPHKTTMTLNFLGDVMLGRMIDYFLPPPNNQPNPNTKTDPDPSTGKTVTNFIRHYPTLLKSYNAKTPWGTTLPLLHSSDLNLANLETAVTTCSTAWPEKMFNYRVHPGNAVMALQAARIDYVSLANNHTLDFGEDGLEETVKVLESTSTSTGDDDWNGVKYAGAGVDKIGPRNGPTVLTLPKTSGHEQQQYKIHVYSASDHPNDWGRLSSSRYFFHLIDYSSKTRQYLKTILNNNNNNKDNKPALKIFSIHWGPNYSWQPDQGTIRKLAHFLVDECGVDIVHGHSAHHVQGVEVRKVITSDTYTKEKKEKKSLIIYGCGDFVDDYAVNREFRNDLGAIWRVSVRERHEEAVDGLELDKLEIFPTRNRLFQTFLLDRYDEDHEWVRNTVSKLSEELGSVVKKNDQGLELGEEGQIVIELH